MVKVRKIGYFWVEVISKRWATGRGMEVAYWNGGCWELIGLEVGISVDGVKVHSKRFIPPEIKNDKQKDNAPAD